jgi:hypothetical protein
MTTDVFGIYEGRALGHGSCISDILRSTGYPVLTKSDCGFCIITFDAVYGCIKLQFFFDYESRLVVRGSGTLCRPH